MSDIAAPDVPVYYWAQCIVNGDPVLDGPHGSLDDATERAAKLWPGKVSTVETINRVPLWGVRDLDSANRSA